jgi:hypothetical protein
LEPDELLPRDTWLLAVLPPPRFPASAADAAFVPEDVAGSEVEVAANAFAVLGSWGYPAIGSHEDVEGLTKVLAFSSESATVWVIFFSGALTVLITPDPERDPSRLNHHLARRRVGWDVAAWGAFPAGARHVPNAARAFLDAAEPLLRGGVPALEDLKPALEHAAAKLSKNVWKRASWAAAQELAASGRHRAAVRAMSSWEQDFTQEQRAFMEKEARAASKEPPPIERGEASDREWFTARAHHITTVNARLKAAFEQREKSPAARGEWTAAATDFHDAVDLLYSDLAQAIARFREGDEEATGYLVTFLEADPWCFRSGYMKGRLYELLRRGALDDGLQRRLRAVALALVDSGYRREFRSACRLARYVADAELIAELRRRLSSSLDRHVRRRALWMLAYVEGGLGEREPAVLEALLDAADEEEWWRASGWVRPLCRRFGDDEFSARIRESALSPDPPTARRGLRLLPYGLREPLDAGERLQLEPLILDAVHERGPAVGLMESLSAIADSKRLRVRLTELAERAESPVSRYAQWALNSAVRANGERAPDL